MNELSPPPEETKAPVEAPKIRPRHYELALAEQAMRRANGRHLGIDEILHRNGFAVDNKDKRSEARQRPGRPHHAIAAALCFGRHSKPRWDYRCSN